MTRWPLVAGALVLDLAIGAALLRTPGPARIHPLAPPLTRIAALGDAPLGPEATPGRALDVLPALEALAREPGGPDLTALRRRAAALPPLVERSNGLRVEVERDALAIAGALGPDRVGAFVASRETLGAAVGEGAAWDAAVEALRP